MKQMYCIDLKMMEAWVNVNYKLPWIPIVTIPFFPLLFAEI